MTIDISTVIFTPIYTAGHWIGGIVAKLIQMTSGTVLPDAMIDTIGILTMMTILLSIADIAKKMARGIVVICWALAIIRIGMLMRGA